MKYTSLYSQQVLARLIRQYAAVAVASALTFHSLASQAVETEEVAEIKASFLIEEVVVTARKRAENLQETPISITVFTASDFEQRSFTTLMDIADQVPNLTAHGGATGGSAGHYYIRGIGQIDFAMTSDPGVGTYLDSVYLGRVPGAVLELAEIDRVEVLKGPQGTLFGRNTIGGAINAVTKKPEFGAFSHTAQLTVGERERFDAKYSVDVPLGQTAAARLSVMSRTQNGFVTSNANERRMGDEKLFASRVSLYATPNDSLEFLLTMDYTKENGTSDEHFLVDDNFLGRQFVISDLGGTRSNDSGVNPNDLESFGVAFTATWNVNDWLAIKSITSYRELNFLTGLDYDGTPGLIFDQTTFIDQKQWSQEIQLSGNTLNNRLNWLAGYFFFAEEGISRNTLFFGGPTLINDQYAEIENTAHAAFGQVTYELTDRLSVTFGGRYSYEKKENILANFGSAAFAIAPTQAGGSWKSFIPKIGAEFKLQKNIFAYASYAEGFKSGGNILRITAGEPETFATFDPEKIKSTEIGFKSEWFRSRVRLNTSVFFNSYQDYQLQVNQTSSVSGQPIFPVKNAAGGDMKGAEIEFIVIPGDAFRLDGSIGLLFSEFEDIDANASITADDKFPSAPELTVHLGTEYSTPVIFNDFRLTLRVDYSYVGDTYFWTPNQSLVTPLVQAKQDAYNLVNIRATLSMWDGMLDLSVFGFNVFNEEHGFYQNIASFNVLYSPSNPAEWGASLTYRF